MKPHRFQCCLVEVVVFRIHRMRTLLCKDWYGRSCRPSVRDILRQRCRPWKQLPICFSSWGVVKHSFIHFHKVVTAHAEGTSPEGAVPHGQSIRRETTLPGTPQRGYVVCNGTPIQLGRTPQEPLLHRYGVDDVTQLNNVTSFLERSKRQLSMIRICAYI